MSVKRKGLAAFLRREISELYPPPKGFIEALSEDAAAYTVSLMDRGLGTISMDLIDGRHFNAKRASDGQPTKDVSLSLVEEDDIEILEKMGSAGALTSRMARVLEDACAVDASFDGRRLALLFPLSLRALRNRLKALWTCGAFLPLAGTSRKNRNFWEDLRGVLAVRHYLEGESLESLQRRMLFSGERWRTWARGYARCYWRLVRGTRDPREVAWDLAIPEPMVEGWFSIVRDLGPDAASPNPLGEAAFPRDPYDGNFHLRLVHRYDYPPPAALSLTGHLRRVASELGDHRAPGEIVHFAIPAGQPLTMSLDNTPLMPVRLEYLHPGDWDYLDVDSPVNLRVHRLRRLASSAYEQGAALTNHDLAYLTGLSTDAVSRVLGQNRDIRSYTRGRVAEIESGIEELEEIHRRYCAGEKAEVIAEELGQDADLVSSYLDCFCRLSGMLDSPESAGELAAELGVTPRIVEICRELRSELEAPPSSS